MDDGAVLETLERCELFTGLPRADLEDIARIGKRLTFAPGEEIAAAGESAGRFFVLLDGEATVSVGGAERRRIGAGDFVGEVALIDGGPRSATVVAETPTETFTLASWNFKPLLERPSVSGAVMRRLCSRLRQLER